MRSVGFEPGQRGEVRMERRKKEKNIVFFIRIYNEEYILKVLNTNLSNICILENLYF